MKHKGREGRREGGRERDGKEREWVDGWMEGKGGQDL